MIIDGDVEIIFLSNHYLINFGTINAGCLGQNAKTIHFYSNSFNRVGGIQFGAQDAGTGYFCNVLFESLKYGIYVDNEYEFNPEQYIYIDHSEFRDIVDAPF